MGAVAHVQPVRAKYHGVVKCALGWACWKERMWGGRRANQIHGMAMNQRLGTV